MAVTLTILAAVVFVSGPGPQAAAGPPGDVSALIEALKSKDTGARLAAAEKLGKMGPAAAAAVPALIDLLRDFGLESVRLGDQTFMTFGLTAGAAADALAQIGKPALQPLRAVLAERDVDESRAVHAAAALALMNLPDATQSLHKLAADGAYPQRAMVIRALGRSSEKRSLDALFGFAGNNDPKVRKAAMQGLDGRKDDATVDALVKGLTDVDAEVRGAAASALRTAAAPATVEPLLAALKDPDAYVRNLSSQALGEIKDTRATEGLIELVVSDKDNLVRFQAGRALEAITGQKFGEDGARWRNWWQERRGKGGDGTLNMRMFVMLAALSGPALIRAQESGPVGTWIFDDADTKKRTIELVVNRENAVTFLRYSWALICGGVFAGGDSTLTFTKPKPVARNRIEINDTVDNGPCRGSDVRLSVTFDSREATFTVTATIPGAAKPHVRTYKLTRSS